jgi:3(or 17)beta-hydroxysteroid dehydrogenase
LTDQTIGFAGRVALVTGAGSGIGAATARMLAERGALVTAADLTLPPEAIQGGEPTLHPVRLDVRDESQWRREVDALLERHGRLDILVHAAGISAASPLTETTLEDWRRVLATNLDGVFLGLKHGVRAMGEQGGAIVVVGSASGIRASAGAAAYSTSKAGATMLARAAAKECRANAVPVRINVVSPAGVKTPMWETMPFFQELIEAHGSVESAFAAMTEAGGGRFAEPEAIAEAILFLCSDEARYVTGVELAIDDGYTL